MESKEIIENNKLIAEFMPNWDGRFYNVPNKGKYHALQLQFDTSWNWLMPVVQHINCMEDYRFSVTIHTMDVEIHDNKNKCNVIEHFSSHDANELIESIYDAVVDFIKWYNKQK